MLHSTNFLKSVSRVQKKIKSSSEPWLDTSSQAHQFWKQIWGQEITRKGEDEKVFFYQFSSNFNKQILKATEDLHTLFLNTTNQVINSDELLSKCSLPNWIWPKIRESWATSKSKTLAGRFDFGLGEDSIKLFEYNSDSAGTYLETASIQNAWARGVGLEIGRSASKDMEKKLVETAKEVFNTPVHLMIDEDDEEKYNALYIQEVLKKAEIQSFLVVGTKGITKRKGKFWDQEGNLVRNVWKTWNWESVINDFQRERMGEVSVSDVLLDDSIQVVEPLWKVVTSNKALLAFISEIHPYHPLLLRTSWELDISMSQKPFVKKPIVGRCGQNIEFFKNKSEKIAGLQGNYGDREVIFQEVFDVQRFDGFLPVLGSWIVGGEAAGFIVREDTKLITDHDSPCACCRVLDD
jgi:glutathionylspermidine amidase/synthetase